MLEFVNNYGMAKLDVRFRYFGGAVALHRLLVTVLWSYRGDNTAAVIQRTEPSALLKMLVAGVLSFGFIVSPILIGLWIKSLHGKQKKRNSESKLEAKDVRLIGPVKSAYRTDVQLREVAGKGFAE
mmetsp:Transcript_17181/g.38697  ORF Transcript_17181/g.38697 Transcript_17181/m.38697 type:complete len:126 (-) Transcript_17181:128-505(-)